MKILIIGSKGFIGQHCLHYFEQKDKTTVYGCDVVVDYESKNYFLIDASNNNFNKIFQQEKFDVCINCSGAASVPDSIKNPGRDYLLNTKNVFEILNSIRQFNVDCKFINLSSAAVYGNPEELPIKESQSTNPVSPYGSHKWQSELICKEMYDYFNIKTCSLRIFSAYGNGLKKQLFWDLFQKSKTSDTISLFGTGKESRDFIHVKDIVQIIELIIQKGSFDASIYNVANGIETNIEEVVTLFYKNFEQNTTLLFQGQSRIGDPINWVADITKLKEIGYKPSILLKDGLKEYIKWAEGLK